MDVVQCPLLSYGFPARPSLLGIRFVFAVLDCPQNPVFLDYLDFVLGGRRCLKRASAFDFCIVQFDFSGPPSVYCGPELIVPVLRDCCPSTVVLFSGTAVCLLWSCSQGPLSVYCGPELIVPVLRDRCRSTVVLS
ncbi:hypothetical protein ACOMHN_052032 [Nucella lapillus]